MLEVRALPPEPVGLPARMSPQTLRRDLRRVSVREPGTGERSSDDGGKPGPSQLGPDDVHEARRLEHGLFRFVMHPDRLRDTGPVERTIVALSGGASTSLSLFGSGAPAVAQNGPWEQLRRWVGACRRSRRSSVHHHVRCTEIRGLRGAMNPRFARGGRFEVVRPASH